MISSRQALRQEEPRGRDRIVIFGLALLIIAPAVALGAIGVGWIPALPALAVAGALVLIWLTARHPVAGLAALVLAVPLTTGLGRGTVVPLLRPHEAVTLVVLTGLLLHYLPLRRRPYAGLDLAVAAFTLGGILIPSLVLRVTHTEADLDTWRAVLAPAQYLVLYWIFSRPRLSARSARVLLNLAMFTSVVVALVAAAQLADLPGVRDFLAANYSSGSRICYGSVCRPTSLLEHWNSVAAFAVLNYTLALALATTRHPGFSGTWLSVVITVNTIGVLVSQTQSAVVGLLLATGVVIWYGRRIPWRELRLPLAGLVLALLIFWPQLTARVDQQLGVSQQVGTPQSLQVRMGYWDAFFIPALAQHFWFGTGTVIPSDIPERLTQYVDNEYLRLGFRAGIVGVALLFLLLTVIGMAAWRCRAGPDPWRRAVGATTLAYALVLTVMGATGEYLTYAGVAQQFWMLVGLLAALHLARPASALAPVTIIGRVGVDDGLRPWLRRFVVSTRPAFGPLRTEVRLIRSSAVVFAGTTTARLLGFLFSVAAARILLPADYGILAYAIAIAGIGSILIGNASTGLSRVLAFHQGDRREQDVNFSNWLVVVTLLVVLSLALVVPLSRVAGLSGWMVSGVMATVLGFAVLQTYREAQRGLERYLTMMVFYVAANILQLAAVLAAAAQGWRNPALFLIIYGLSSLASLAVMQVIRPIPLSFVRQALTWRRMATIGKFIWPLLLQTAFFAVWFGADLILVARLLRPEAVGNYAAAKTLVTVVYLAPSAIAVAVVPRAAQVAERALRKYVAALLILTAAVTVPAMVGVALLGKPITALVFGDKYPHAAAPLSVLAIGMAFWGFYLVLESLWLGLGRPQIDAVATGVGMACTIGVGLLLLPEHGLTGAAVAFTAGSGTQLAIIASFTAWQLHFRRGTVARQLQRDGQR